MPRQTIPQISVEGVELPVYSFDFSAGVQENPSEISIGFINEDGVYTEPELTVNVATTITVGDDYVFNYYPVESSVSRGTSGGRIMTVKYRDKSVILDKIFVGLKNKHGYVSEMPILIVGTEVDPCESLLDGSIQDSVSDPCNPCTVDGKEGSDLQERLIDCLERRQYSILEVEYTFNQLLDEILASTGIQLAEERPFSNDRYKAKYTGTLRSVLQNWGSDYGFTFYWDEDDILQFQDMRGGLEINDSDIDDGDNIISENTTNTLEGTVAKAPIAYFQRDGQLRKYDCENNWCKIIKMAPVLLEDIVEVHEDGEYGTVDRLQLMVALSVYSPHLRDAYVWFEWAGIQTVADAVAHEGLPSSALLGMKILKVVDKNVHGEWHTAMRETVFGKDTEEAQDFERRGGYFFKAKYNKDQHTKWYEFEAALGTDFMGKYFVRRFTENFKGTSYSYLTPDGDSIKYYRRTDPLQLPFVNLLKDNLGKAKAYLSALVDPTTGETASDHFLLLERNALWWPLKQDSKELTELLDIVDKESFKEIGQIAFRAGGADAAEWDQFYLLDEKKGETWMIGYELQSGLSITARGEFDHPIDVENVSLDVEACRLGQSKYGLRDAKCQVYTINFGSDAAASPPQKGTNVYIATPAQSHKKAIGEGITPHSGYDIIWERNGTQKTEVLQRKIELVDSELVPPLETNVLALDINNRDVTQDLFDIFDNDLENLCNPLVDIIKTRMQSVISGLEFTIDTPFKKRGYVLAGLPPRRYTIADGLESLQLRIGSDGLETHINFGNVRRSPISSNFFVQQYEAWHDKNRRNSISAEDLPSPATLETL